MAIKIYRPTSAGRRNMSAPAFTEITRSKPERSLLAPLRKKAGRNNSWPHDHASPGWWSQAPLPHH